MDIPNIAACIARELGSLVRTGIDGAQSQGRGIHVGFRRQW
jgi:hypothetical protein